MRAVAFFAVLLGTFFLTDMIALDGRGTQAAKQEFQSLSKRLQYEIWKMRFQSH
jgi:hypothetical protein